MSEAATVAVQPGRDSTPESSDEQTDAAPLGSVSSARSLLMTVLGEFVRPGDGSAWTTTLVHALVELGVARKSSRQALARLAAKNFIAQRREGRRVAWSLTSSGQEALDRGAARIYTFGRTRPEWDGNWLGISVVVPETQRQLRQRLRTQLSWLGMRVLVPGLWVTPDVRKQDELHRIVAELELSDDSVVWSGQVLSSGTGDTLVQSMWNLDEVADTYRQFIAQFADLEPATDREAFLYTVQLVQRWRHFPYTDPELPIELLPDDWPGIAAADLFYARHAQWQEAAQRYWADLEADAASRR